MHLDLVSLILINVFVCLQKKGVGSAFACLVGLTTVCKPDTGSG